jgi:hypothetical protein
MLPFARRFTLLGASSKLSADLRTGAGVGKVSERRHHWSLTLFGQAFLACAKFHSRGFELEHCPSALFEKAAYLRVRAAYRTRVGLAFCRKPGFHLTLRQVPSSVCYHVSLIHNQQNTPPRFKIGMHLSSPSILQLHCVPPLSLLFPADGGAGAWAV